jgi:hypothetical protein
VLPTPRQQEEAAAEDGSSLSLQAAAQPLPGAAAEPLWPNPILGGGWGQDQICSEQTKTWPHVYAVPTPV